LNIGFDVDGVIAKAPLGLHKFLRYYQRGWNRLLLNPLGIFLYRKLRKADKGIREAMGQLKSEGHQIIIISYIIERNKDQLERWLKENMVPFDKMVVAKEGESPLEFKVRAIIEEKCDVYVEDQPTLARDISLRVPGAKIILV
jgi:uncharacterized HAD superfamily protein